MGKKSNKMLLTTKKVRMKSRIKNQNQSQNPSLGLNQNLSLIKNPLLRHWES